MKKLLRRIDKAGLRQVLEEDYWDLQQASYEGISQLMRELEDEADVQQVLRRTELYIFEQLENVARLRLQFITGRQALNQYCEILNGWLAEMLPEIEQKFDIAVDRGRLAQRMAFWRAKAIKLAIKIEDGLDRIGMQRITEHIEPEYCLDLAYEVVSNAFTKAGEELTERLLTKNIPSIVAVAVINRGWFPNPPDSVVLNWARSRMAGVPGSANRENQGRAGQTTDPGSKHATNGGSAQPRNLAILRGADEELKRAVNLDVASRYGGVSRRAIEKAAKKGSLKP